MKKTLTFLFMSMISLGAMAQTEYYTGWDNPTENAGWTQIKKGDTGPYEWELDATSSVSPDSCIAHYYPVGGSVPTDDWFVSPVFDFSAGGWIDTLWHNYNGFGTPMAGDTIVLYLLNGSSDPDLATKTALYSFTDSTYNADNTWYELLMIPVGTFAGDSYLAFRYYTTNNWLDVKFDNLKVTAFSTAGVSTNLLTTSIDIYPNPANTEVTFTISGELRSDLTSIKILNSLGQIVEQLSVNTNKIDLSAYESGIYFLELSTNTARFTERFIVSK